ncbi:MAG: 4-(cytidine 5'-diphospho)-2-C-methyl-D-erythritol kinase [Actinobacteria bacterium HGW-Actinobacteria-1]|nr:MAG: 4-(cytidine 5'-diphospho)-2-C-methyl-D-erythritol kinase [Actinobacteria bacterium HGW-Actinobacteria-1]
MSAERITLLAPAKVNLFLAVGDRRPDGYHDVVTILQALDERVADTVIIERADVLTVICEPSIGIPAEENLAFRALEGLGALVGREPAFSVTISKRVPAAGGLGGASADAAAALVGACRLWGLPADSPEVTALAASLGADVPFFIAGGTALYAGRGDMLVRRLDTPALDLVVVNPGVPVSTPAAYATFDRLLRPAVPTVDGMLRALASHDIGEISAQLFNNLAEAACDLAPEVAEALHFVSQSEGVLGAIVSGSGSSVFGVCEDAETAERVAHDAGMHGDWWASATMARPGGSAEIESGSVLR